MLQIFNIDQLLEPMLQNYSLPSWTLQINKLECLYNNILDLYNIRTFKVWHLNNIPQLWLHYLDKTFQGKTHQLIFAREKKGLLHQHIDPML